MSESGDRSDGAPVPVAVIGCGRMGRFHARVYSEMPGVKLVGVCDLDREKAERNARRWGGRVYTDLGQMLGAEKPDGVIVCTGPEGHAALAPVVMRAGIPVYTEKPPALSAADTLAVARVSRETGVLCTTAFKKRYATAYQRAKEWLAQFDEADFYSIGIDYASAQYSNDRPHRLFLFDFCIHAIDLIGYLFGDAREVFAFSKGPDAYAVSIRFAGGAVGSMNLNDGRSFGIPTEEVEMTVRGGNFMTIHNSSVWRITENNKCSEWREPPTFTSAGDSGNDTGHLAELADFVAAVREKRSTRSNIFESYKSMVLYEAIGQSAETGAVVPVRCEAV